MPPLELDGAQEEKEGGQKRPASEIETAAKKERVDDVAQQTEGAEAKTETGARLNGNETR